MSLANLGLVLLNALLLVSGQLLWKIGVERNPAGFSSFSSGVHTLLSPYVLTGLLIYAVATVLWLFILTRTELSKAYPAQSIAYVIAVVAAYYLFDEPFTWLKVVGTVLIIGGVSAIGASGS